MSASYQGSEFGTLSDAHRRALPEDLKQDPSWVLWRYVVRDGKQTKEPYQRNRRKAKTDTSQTWTSFEQALETYQQDDFFDGIGFVFHEDNPYAGADIDDATEDQAREWLERFDSYAERSPSENGLHIIIKAELSEGTNRRGRGELYSTGRFFTMTGNVVRDLPVRDAQDAADEYYAYLRKDDQAPPTERASARFDSPDLEDAEVLRLLENARNGSEFAMIYAGLGDFPSPSERDISLANRIAFYTQDEEQIERIMRGSGCVREKWDKHRSYLRTTIRKATRDLTNTYSPPGVFNINKARASKKVKLQTGIRDLLRRWWNYDWSRVTGTEERPNWMRGHTCRDVMIALIETAAKHGHVAEDTIEVGIGRRKLALLAATSLRTVHKAVRHLEAEGWLEFRPPKSENQPGTYVMRATLHQVLTPTAEGRGIQALEGGGEDLREGGSVARLRWSAPYIRRLGKHNGAIIDRLLREGDMHLEELAEAANKRTRDLLGRNLPKLQEAGIIDVDDSIVRLAAGWREALERKREEDEEIEAEKRDRKKYREQSENYRNRDRTPADEQPNPLRGKEAVRKMTAERAREDKRRWVEEQRRKVGMTAMTFLADEIDGEYGVRFQDAAERWRNLHGGSASELWRAVHYGPFMFRRVQGDLFVDPEPREPAAAPEPEPEVHPLDCECLDCSARSPSYARAFGGAA